MFQTHGDIAKVAEDRRAYAKSRNITLQPYLIVVGEEKSFSVDSIYLCINDIQYEMNKVSEALECCFKSFHVLNAKYTAQSEQIYLLLQVGVFKFRTKWDSYFGGVEELLNDIQMWIAPL